MSDMLDWAKREVEIACKKENPNRKEGEFDYGYACYESALKAFKSLCEDGHSGFGIKMTQAILNRLLNVEPLTPIEDTDDIWDKCSRPKDGPEVYQCSRMFSLFKNIYPDGSVKYSDNNRVFCVDINDPNTGIPMESIPLAYTTLLKKRMESRNVLRLIGFSEKVSLMNLENGLKYP